MVYKVRYADKIEKDLKKVDKKTAGRILDKIDTVLVKDPCRHGKQLKGALKGLWRYRVGDYRVLYRIVDEAVVILVLRIGHRKNIYNN